MPKRSGAHFRHNVVAYLALFVALGGTAIAAKPLITGADVQDGSLTGADVGDDSTPGALTGTDIANSSLTGLDVADNSLGGDDVSEASLGQVASAVLGGLGRSANQNNVCNPEDETGDVFPGPMMTCVSVGPIDLPAETRVLLVGSINGETEVGGAGGNGFCRLRTSVTGGLDTTKAETNSHEGPETSGQVGGEVAMTVVTTPLPPGPVSFGIECAEDGGQSEVFYIDAMLSVVALAPS